MLSCKGQSATEIDQTRTIEIQAFDGSTAFWGKPQQIREVFIPAKVLLPVILAWMVERHNETGNRIGGGDSGELPVVATLAGKSKIIQAIRSPRRPWKNVLNREIVV